LQISLSSVSIFCFAKPAQPFTIIARDFLAVSKDLKVDSTVNIQELFQNNYSFCFELAVPDEKDAYCWKGKTDCLQFTLVQERTTAFKFSRHLSLCKTGFAG